MKRSLIFMFSLLAVSAAAQQIQFLPVESLLPNPQASTIMPQGLPFSFDPNAGPTLAPFGFNQPGASFQQPLTPVPFQPGASFGPFFSQPTPLQLPQVTPSLPQTAPGTTPPTSQPGTTSPTPNPSLRQP